MQSNYRVIDLKKLIVLLAAALIFVCGCTPVKGGKTVSVTIVDSIFYTAEHSCAKVAYGEDFSTVLHLRAGYEFISCDYSRYETKSTPDGVVLTLKNVTRPSRVIVTCDKRSRIPDKLDLKCTID